MKYLLLLTILVFSLNTYSKQNKRPFAEFEKVKYVVLGTEANEYYDVGKFLKNLPTDIVPIIYWVSSDSLKKFKDKNKKYFSRFKKIEFRETNIHNIVWTRDILPIPVCVSSDSCSEEALAFVNFQHFFDSISSFDTTSVVPGKMVSSCDKRFDGGNFISDKNGNCFTVPWKDKDPYKLKQQIAVLPSEEKRF